MTTHQLNLIRNSWKLAAMYPEATGSLFYETLFELSPETVYLFRHTNMNEQSMKLVPMLTYVVDRLDRFEDIIEEVANLARRHVKYGVRGEHYTAVGKALMITLEKGLGNSWNAEVKEAWENCYKVLSAAMMGAAGYEHEAA